MSGRHDPTPHPDKVDMKYQGNMIPSVCLLTPRLSSCTTIWPCLVLSGGCSCALLEKSGDHWQSWMICHNTVGGHPSSPSVFSFISCQVTCLVCERRKRTYMRSRKAREGMQQYPKQAVKASSLSPISLLPPSCYSQPFSPAELVAYYGGACTMRQSARICKHLMAGTHDPLPIIQE